MGETGHLFAETDGQVYLVRRGARWRFPTASEGVPFPADRTLRMDFGSEVVWRLKPKLARHPAEWSSRDDLFSRADVDDLVKRAVYMTMGRLVAEVVIVRDGKVLMEKASRGFSKGHWNLPGGFLEFGEAPEDAARRETEEEIGVRVELDGLLNTYVSGFPGKPTYTYGFVYRGRLLPGEFRLNPDEIEAVDWWPAWRGLELTRNPFAKWAIVDAYRGGLVPELPIPRHHPRPGNEARRGPVLILESTEPRESDRGTPDPWLLPSALEALRGLTAAGWRLAIATNADTTDRRLPPERDLRRSWESVLRPLKAAGAHVENVYHCRHARVEDCPCRMPRGGLLLAIFKDLDAGPKDAWILCDTPAAVRAGKAIGARTALVGDARRRAEGARELGASGADLIAPNLKAVARSLRKLAPPAPAAYT